MSSLVPVTLYRFPDPSTVTATNLAQLKKQATADKTRRLISIPRIQPGIAASTLSVFFRATQNGPVLSFNIQTDPTQSTPESKDLASRIRNHSSTRDIITYLIIVIYKQFSARCSQQVHAKYQHGKSSHPEFSSAHSCLTPHLIDNFYVQFLSDLRNHLGKGRLTESLNERLLFLFGFGGMSEALFYEGLNLSNQIRSLVSERNSLLLTDGSDMISKTLGRVLMQDDGGLSHPHILNGIQQISNSVNLLVQSEDPSEQLSLSTIISESVVEKLSPFSDIQRVMISLEKTLNTTEKSQEESNDQFLEAIFKEMAQVTLHLEKLFEDFISTSPKDGLYRCHLHEIKELTSILGQPRHPEIEKKYRKLDSLDALNKLKNKINELELLLKKDKMDLKRPDLLHELTKLSSLITPAQDRIPHTVDYKIETLLKSVEHDGIIHPNCAFYHHMNSTNDLPGYVNSMIDSPLEEYMRPLVIKLLNDMTDLKLSTYATYKNYHQAKDAFLYKLEQSFLQKINCIKKILYLINILHKLVADIKHIDPDKVDYIAMHALIGKLYRCLHNIDMQRKKLETGWHDHEGVWHSSEVSEELSNKIATEVDFVLQDVKSPFQTILDKSLNSHKATSSRCYTTKKVPSKKLITLLTEQDGISQKNPEIRALFLKHLEFYNIQPDDLKNAPLDHVKNFLEFWFQKFKDQHYQRFNYERIIRTQPNTRERNLKEYTKLLFSQTGELGNHSFYCFQDKTNQDALKKRLSKEGIVSVQAIDEAPYDKLNSALFLFFAHDYDPTVSEITYLKDLLSTEAEDLRTLFLSFHKVLTARFSSSKEFGHLFSPYIPSYFKQKKSDEVFKELKKIMSDLPKDIRLRIEKVENSYPELIELLCELRDTHFNFLTFDAETIQRASRKELIAIARSFFDTTDETRYNILLALAEQEKQDTVLYQSVVLLKNLTLSNESQKLSEQSDSLRHCAAGVNLQRKGSFKDPHQLQLLTLGKKDEQTHLRRSLDDEERSKMIQFMLKQVYSIQLSSQSFREILPPFPTHLNHPITVRFKRAKRTYQVLSTSPPAYERHPNIPLALEELQKKGLFPPAGVSDGTVFDLSLLI